MLLFRSCWWQNSEIFFFRPGSGTFSNGFVQKCWNNSFFKTSFMILSSLLWYELPNRTLVLGHAAYDGLFTWNIRTNYINHMVTDWPSLSVYRLSHSSPLNVKPRQVWIGVNPSAVHQQADLPRNNRKNADLDLKTIWKPSFSLRQSIYRAILPHICRNQLDYTILTSSFRHFQPLNWIFTNLSSC